MGGTSSELTNVTIEGDYYYGINLYGTHGATMTNCDIVTVFTNGSDDYKLNLVNTKIGHLFANESEIDEGAKIFIDADSTVDELTFWGDADKSGALDSCDLAVIRKATLFPDTEYIKENLRYYRKKYSDFCIKGLLFSERRV